MMFRWINKQPGIQKFRNWCRHYQDIYDWIPPINKLSGVWFIPTLHSMGVWEYGESDRFSIFTSLKHLMMLLKCNFFQGFIDLHLISKTLTACRNMQLRFFIKWKLLNNALNWTLASCNRHRRRVYLQSRCVIGNDLSYTINNYFSFFPTFFNHQNNPIE